VPEADIYARRGVDGKRIEALLIRGGVALLAAVAVIFLVAIAVLASAAATGNETLFDIMAWLIPLMGVVSLVLALGGTIVVRRMMKGQASSARPEATGEAAKETAPVVGQDPADRDRRIRNFLRQDKLHPLSEVNRAFAKALDLTPDNVAVTPRGDDVLVVRAELPPGVTPDEVSIKYKDEVFTKDDLFSIRKRNKSSSAISTYTWEYVLLPQPVGKEDGLSHRFVDGVWEVTIKGATPRAPIPGYDEMDEAKVSEQLNDMSAEELLLVRDYEKRNQKRQSLLEQMNRKISDLKKA
jgi:hypothetical protein